ncbi:MAG: alpha-ketoacid dehydrogenase subunit beta, partial [Armatimonadota bacterium]
MSEPVTYLEAIRQAHFEEMRRDPEVFVLGQDVGAYGGAFQVTQGLHEEFGSERVMDMPIAESGIVGVAIGAALLGMRPIAEMQFVDFISCAFDQIVNQAATMVYRYGGNARLPLVIRGPAGGGVHGGPFHSQTPEAWFFHVPGLKIVFPATVYDAKGLLKAAVRDDDPVLYFEHKYLYRRLKEELPEDDFVVPIGEAMVARDGDDLTMVTYGAMLHQCLTAAETLAGEGIEAEVIDLRTLLPLDLDTVKQSFQKTSKALIAHEDSKQGGIGAEIAAVLAQECFEYLDGPIVRIGAPFTHVPFS